MSQTRNRIASLAFVTLAAGLSAFALSCAKSPSGETPSATNAAMTPEQKIERGRYLTIVAGCNDCHTPGTLFGAADTTRRFSGSEVGWGGPWGVSFAANLTPDMETGLGNYTEDDIVSALTTGKKKSGAPILPPMPWPMYQHMTSEDVHAVAAYLKSLPAVSHKVPANVNPGGKTTQPVIVIPAPSAWDAPRGAAPEGGAK